jgi:SAM-dependent methyltransferase
MLKGECFNSDGAAAMGILSPAQQAVQAVHGSMIFSRRVRVLSQHLASMLPEQGFVLDVGAGSGDIAVGILSSRPNLRIEGVDVLVRPDAAILVREFDGTTLPYDDDSFDFAMLVDVLHHTDNPAQLLREVTRVARSVLIKDHFRNGFLAHAKLRLMDWVGNAHHGVRLPYNYLSRAEWASLWPACGLRVAKLAEDLRIYASPVDWIFGRGLHFIAVLERAE